MLVGTTDDSGKAPSRVARVIRHAKNPWIYLADLTIAVVFLTFGSTTGRIIGAALLVVMLVMGVLIARRRKGSRSALRPGQAATVRRLLVVGGLFAIAAGIYSLIFKSDPVIALLAVLLGSYCVVDARKQTRRIRSHGDEAATVVPPATEVSSRRGRPGGRSGSSDSMSPMYCRRTEGCAGANE